MSIFLSNSLYFQAQKNYKINDANGQTQLLPAPFNLEEIPCLSFIFTTFIFSRWNLLRPIIFILAGQKQMKKEKNNGPAKIIKIIAAANNNNVNKCLKNLEVVCIFDLHFCHYSFCFSIGQKWRKKWGGCGSKMLIAGQNKKTNI